MLFRYHEFSSDDRLRDLIGANVDSTVKAMARSKAEERSAYQVISHSATLAKFTYGALSFLLSKTRV